MHYRLKTLALVAGLAALATQALAQVPSFNPPPAGWTQQTRPTNISASSVSSNVSLGTSPGPNVLVYNTGTVAAFVKFGATAPTAVAANDIPVPAGGCALLRSPVGSAFIGAITVSGTTTLVVSTGTGTPLGNCGTNTAGGGGTQTVVSSSQYPSGATPITGNAAGTTGAVVGTLANTSGKTTYICGFDVSAIGGTAAVGPVTVAGLTGSSAVYQMSSSAAGSNYSRTFSPCIPASAANTAITITTTADGTATAVNVNSHGYQL